MAAIKTFAKRHVQGTDINKPLLAIDTSQSATVRLALVGASGVICPEDVRIYPAESLPTFTDALLRLHHETGVDLRSCHTALAIAGPVTSGPIRIARTRWTISRESLAPLLGSELLIINEVAARAWAATTAASRAEPLRGTRQPDWHLPGRYVLLLVEEGVGSAIIDVDKSGSVRIVEGEGGLVDFAATDAHELAMAAALNLRCPVTWEDMLILPPDSPAWSVGPVLQASDRKLLVAAWLGRFTVNMILASAAWNGVLLVGTGAALLRTGGVRAPFDAAFALSRAHRRIISTVPCWYIAQKEAVLAGTLALLVNQARSKAA